MKTYEVQSLYVPIQSGRVQIDGAQAKNRTAKLKAVEVDAKTGAGLYAVAVATGFKRGERFGYDGELPKNLANEVKDVADDVVTEDSGAAVPTPAEGAPPASGFFETAQGAKSRSRHRRIG